MKNIVVPSNLFEREEIRNLSKELDLSGQAIFIRALLHISGQTDQRTSYTVDKYAKAYQCEPDKVRSVFKAMVKHGIMFYEDNKFHLTDLSRGFFGLLKNDKAKAIKRAEKQNNFVAPTIEQVQEFYKQKSVDDYIGAAQTFFDFYEERDWMLGGRSPRAMKDWTRSASRALREWDTMQRHKKEKIIFG